MTVLESKDVKFFDDDYNCMNNQLEENLELDVSKSSELSSPEETGGRIRGNRIGETLTFADVIRSTPPHNGSVLANNVPDDLIASKLQNHRPLTRYPRRSRGLPKKWYLASDTHSCPSELQSNSNKILH